MSLIVATSQGLCSLEVDTGNHIKTYKQCEGIRNGIVVLKGASTGAGAGAAGAARKTTTVNSLLAVQNNKPLIHHYSLKKEGIMKRIVLPIKPRALSLSPNGQYLAAGSADGSLYVWDLSSGALTTLQNEVHFQALTVLDWSKDSSVLVSGGDDARVLIWRTIDLIAGESPAPKHIFTGHNLPIVSCVISYGTFREARLYTASRDATVSVVDIFSGKLLYTLACDCALQSLALDPAERAIYLGANDGVHVVPLYYEPSRSAKLVAAGSADGGVVSVTDIEKVLKQGESPVTCLTLSADASHLFVGTEDGQVSCWETGSAQMVKKYRATKGPVEALIYTNDSFASPEQLQTLPMLQRNLSHKLDALEVVPSMKPEPFAFESLNDIDENEFESIRVHTSSDKGAVSELAEESGDAESASDAAAELKELKARHEQLKKMYDALWARHSSK